MCLLSRDVHWSAELLHYAWHNKAKVQAMEAQLEDFASSAQKRRSLPSMPKQERHIMHQLADSYGLATQSFGSEPARHIDIFKVTVASESAALQLACTPNCKLDADRAASKSARSLYCCI